jgi:ribosomal protein S18 acetylase RimI-like enzyme
MAVATERIDPTDPLAVELASAMVAELRGIYGDRVTGETPTAEPHELSGFVVVRADGRPVAGGALKPLGDGKVEIKRMYVRPEDRSHGHARRLLEGLEAAAREDGWARIRLDTGAEQPHARALYESAGYREIPDYNGNPYATYWAEKDLPAVVPARFNGPPASGHGGYSAWVAARYLEAGAVEVSLRQPPPLDTPMEVVRDGTSVALCAARDHQTPSGDRVTMKSRVLEAAPVDLEGVEAPAALDVDAARAARDPSLWAAEVHPFPTCFACGPLHPDGLHLYPGAVGDGRYATDWTPPVGCEPSLVWSALDCPSWAPFMAAEREGACVLARLAVTIASLPPAEPHAIVAEPVAIDGRKHTSVVGLYSADGELRAAARALWIELRPDA